MSATTSAAPISDAPATRDEPVVKCAALTKIYRDFWFRPRVRAVDRIDLEIRRGEVFGLLGPNGSGKSTTIKMILGLLYPTSGRIAVFGKRPEDVATKQRIGYLPEESYLYRFLTARETLDYYGRLFHQDRHQRKRRIDMLLSMVGLDGVANRAVGEFSKGMQRRIGLAQALINDPDLLILDEPTTGMDPIGTRQIKDLILELARPRNGKPGKTILLCSHLLSDVEDVCHRVSIMFGGKVRALGTCDELLIRQDMTTIQTPVLDVQTIQEIENLLEARGKHIDRVEQPRQKLESLFLDIVTKAHAEGLTTAGAKAGGQIAQFLLNPDGKPATETDQVINQLISGANAPAPAPGTPGAGTPGSAAGGAAGDAKAAPAKPVEPTNNVLAELTGPKPAPVARPQAGGQPAAEEKPDTDLLDSLLGQTPPDDKTNRSK